MGGSNAQDSTLERRSTIWNDGDPIPPAVPPVFCLNIKDRGKFFTRGCRGKIHRLYVYCMRAAAGTMDLSFSPHPCLGPLYTVTVTPGAAWAWANAGFFQMWNYDSLFIWVSRCDADVSWGYDLLQPRDGHRTTDSGETWFREAWRPFIRAEYDGETPGDVPVSGIINNIPIPNSSSSFAFVNAVIVMGPGGVDLAVIPGAGFVDLLVVYLNPVAFSHLTEIIVECDGVIAFNQPLSALSTLFLNDDTQPISLLTYVADGEIALMLTKKWEFRRLFRLRGVNIFGNQTVTGFVCPNLMR